jgi:hypothetical protein
MLKKVLIITASLILLLTAAFCLWALTPSGPGERAEYTLVNPAPVSIIQEGDRISFIPAESRAGIIIYPGGRVDFRSYAPLARELAFKGYSVFIVKMPLNMAFFDIDRGAEVLSDYPEIQDWTLAGHSLGGIAASLYIKKEPALFNGLIYLAAYPPESADLSQWTGKVLSLRGSEDHLVLEDDIKESSPRLPENTRYINIEGGNHAQFGDYGPQKGDGAPTISPDEQLNQTVKAILAFIP